MGTLYEVTATQDRHIKVGGKKVRAEYSYITYHCFQQAESAEDAVDIVKSYYIAPGTKFNRIRAVAARD